MSKTTIPSAPFAFVCTPEFIAAAETEGNKLPRVKMVAYTGGAMIIGGWGSTPVIVSLAGLKIPDSVPLRFQHDGYEIVGHSTDVRVEGAKLLLDGVISFDTPRARSIVAAAVNGFPWQASVGVAPDIDGVKFVAENQTMDINGATRKGPFYAVTKGRLREVSILDLGADPQTKVQIAAMATETNMPDEPEIQTPPAGGNNSTVIPPVPPASSVRAGDTLDAIIGDARAEQLRRERIIAMVRAASTAPGADLDALQRIGNEAVTATWSERDTELALLRAGRTVPSVGVQPSGAPPTEAVLAAALLMSCGISHEKLVKDPDFGEKTVEAAWKRSKGRISLHELFATALKANGVHVGHGGEQVFQALVQSAPMIAMQQARGHGDIQAGFSTVSLPGILGTVGNKLLLDSFTQVATTFQDICQLSDFSNFLTYTQYRLTATGGMRKVASSGEIKHASLGEESYQNRLDTSGMMLTLTRQQIVNDDLNALQQMYKITGRDAALSLERAVYDAFMEPSDIIFTSARGNRLTTSALSLTTLQAAEAALLAQQNENGDPIYAQASRLIVPPPLKALADSIFVSETIVSGNTSGQPAANTMRGRMKPVCSPYLSLATGPNAVGGASPSTWYLACDPAMLPFLQAAFLQGKRAPTVETADAQFNTLGISLRAFFDFGVAVVDYRGANKSSA